MEIFFQIIKLLYRIKYWLIILPAVAALLAVYQTRHMTRTYEVGTTIYTGIASGFTIESGADPGRIDWGSVNNGMDNLISIIKSKNTLHEVSLRLYAQNMIYGDSTENNNYIQSNNYKELLRITPKEVRALIDKSSVDSTISNLKKYEQASPTNFVYGLFNWYHRHYSYTALSKIDVKRIFDSDMLDIKYSADDPGIAYNTLVILNEEFVKQYKLLRFGETNDVVDYFRRELARLSDKLKQSEDSLTSYYVDKKIINYGEQTKQVTALARDYELLYYDALLRYTSASTSVGQLEMRIESQVKAIQNNTIFLQKLKNLSDISSRIIRFKSMQSDSTNISPLNKKMLDEYNAQQKIAEDDLHSFSSMLSDQKYTKDGVASAAYVDQWVSAVIMREKSSAELKVMEDVRKSLEAEYGYYSPIGSTLKRKERDISFTEQSYLSVLTSLNAALLRQKTLQMSSANLKAINPPLFPVSPIPTARKVIVLSTYFATFIFIIAFFILLELFDRTVRDKSRAERITNTKVLGAFPKENMLRYRRYNKQYEEIATNYLANALIPYLNTGERPDIINFISSGSEYGKSYLAEKLVRYWEERGLRVKLVSWHDGISPESREFILSRKFSELYEFANEDIIIVEHRSILESSIPVGLLREASINLIVVRADKVWREVDATALERLKQQAQSAPVTLYLNQVNRDVATSFLGLLPPITKFRQFLYKLTQLGLTSR
jgi:capsular polysaccharide biosynthesis protein